MTSTTWTRPSPNDVWRAVETYLRLAYVGSPPQVVGSRLEMLRTSSTETFYDCPAFEKDSPTEPSKYALRLGSRAYPHLKLVIERAPDGEGTLFEVDTHDRHCCPETSSPDYGKFRDLMEQNQRLATEVESAWAREGLPTFRQRLRRDVELRVGANSTSANTNPFSTARSS